MLNINFGEVAKQKIECISMTLQTATSWVIFQLCLRSEHVVGCRYPTFCNKNMQIYVTVGHWGHNPKSHTNTHRKSHNTANPHSINHFKLCKIWTSSRVVYFSEVYFYFIYLHMKPVGVFASSISGFCKSLPYFLTKDQTFVSKIMKNLKIKPSARSQSMFLEYSRSNF